MVQQASLDDLRKTFDRAVYGAEKRAWIIGLVGMRNQDGTTTINVPDRVGWVYVSIGPTGNQVVSMARNDSLVPLRAQLPVRMKRDSDQALVIYGVYNAGGFADKGTGGDLHNQFGIIWHHHRIGGGLEYEHEALLFDQGRGFGYDDAFSLYINSFRYQRKRDGVWDTWLGGTIDLLSFQPSTVGHWAWVVVGVDPETNTAVAVAGTSQVYATALTIDLIDDVDFLEYIPCIAVRIRNDATTITNNASYLQDAHKWFGQTALTLDDLTDVNASYPVANDEMWYDGSGWVTGVGHRLNMDDVITLELSSDTLDLTGNKTDGLFYVRSEVINNPDTLETIVGGNDGDVIVLVFFGAGEFITIVNTDNIRVPNSDIVLNSAGETCVLINFGGRWNATNYDLRLDNANVPITKSFEHFVDKKERMDIFHMHGTFDILATGQALDSSPTDLNVTNGLSKMIIVVNAGSDTDGEITVTGTSVDRNTGVETPSDTDVITVLGTTANSSSTDSNGNTEWGFTNAYITSKWFKGAVVLSTVDLTLTDVDVYQVAFEQFHDDPDVIIQTLDVTLKVTNDSAWADIYMYLLEVDGDTCVLSTITEIHLATADATAGCSYRFRRDNLLEAIDGTTDGFWIELNLGPINQPYFEDIGVKVYYDTIEHVQT